MSQRDIEPRIASMEMELQLLRRQWQRAPLYSSGRSCCTTRWEIWTQATGTTANSGTFELIVTYRLDVDDLEATLDIDWNESASSLAAKINGITGLSGYTVLGGPINTRSLVVGTGNNKIREFEIGTNDLLSGRPYIRFAYRSEDLIADE